MNTVEKLLKLDAGKIKMPEKVIKLTPKKLGIEVDFPCKALNPERFSEIQEDAVIMKKGDVKKIKMYAIKSLIVIDGCPEIFKSKELMDHYGCPTPKELLNKLLLSGEVDDLYDAISELSGYDRDEEDEEDIKN